MTEMQYEELQRKLNGGLRTKIWKRVRKDTRGGPRERRVREIKVREIFTC